MTSDIVAVDIGGTHARFAIAAISQGQVTGLRDEHRFKCADDPGFAAAWARYAAALGRPLPAVAAIAVASPVGGAEIRLVNNGWTIDPALLAGQIGVNEAFLINDFAAVAHAVAQAPASAFRYISGPDMPLPDAGAISVIGPGTGLGVAVLARGDTGYRVMATEGGHSSFAALDAAEDRLAAQLRARFGRVSVERVVSGPGLRAIMAAFADTGFDGDDAAIWKSALAGDDLAAAAALGSFCQCLGAFAGDMALAHGTAGVVLAGSLANRLVDHPALLLFARRFTAKGRFAADMAQIPVRLLTLAEPGLFGAAAAFAAS